MPVLLAEGSYYVVCFYVLKQTEKLKQHGLNRYVIHPRLFNYEECI